MTKKSIRAQYTVTRAEIRTEFLAVQANIKEYINSLKQVAAQNKKPTKSTKSAKAVQSKKVEETPFAPENIENAVPLPKNAPKRDLEALLSTICGYSYSIL
jgi:hypothetical protein